MHAGRYPHFGSAGTGTRRGPKILAAVMPPALLTMALVFAIAVLPFTLRDVGPAWSAHLGHGEPGIFTAYTESCSRSCTWHGTFTADSGYTRTDVLMASGNDISQVGEVVAAVDTGDPKVVYPVGGGTDWILITGVLAVQGVTIVGVSIYLLRKLRRRLAPRALPVLAVIGVGFAVWFVVVGAGLGAWLRAVPARLSPVGFGQGRELLFELA